MRTKKELIRQTLGEKRAFVAPMKKGDEGYDTPKAYTKEYINKTIGGTIGALPGAVATGLATARGNAALAGLGAAAAIGGGIWGAVSSKNKSRKQYGVKNISLEEYGARALGATGGNAVLPLAGGLGADYYIRKQYTPKNKRNVIK